MSYATAIHSFLCHNLDLKAGKHSAVNSFATGSQVQLTLMTDNMLHAATLECYTNDALLLLLLFLTLGRYIPEGV